MDTEFARRQMVEQQVRAWDVLDPDVLETLAKVPREAFVPDAFRELAFADMEIPLGHDEVMMTPTVEGRLLDALDIGPSDKVFEVGTGSGFLTACLATLGAQVHTVDIHEDFLERAAGKLASAGFDNVSFACQDVTQELPDDIFDAIAVTGSLQHFDPRFVERLAPGGRLFIITGDEPVMEARRVTRSGEREWSSEDLFETRIRRLVNGTPPPAFTF